MSLKLIVTFVALIALVGHNSNTFAQGQRMMTAELSGQYNGNHLGSVGVSASPPDVGGLVGDVVASGQQGSNYIRNLMSNLSSGSSGAIGSGFSRLDAIRQSVGANALQVLQSIQAELSSSANISGDMIRRLAQLLSNPMQLCAAAQTLSSNAGSSVGGGVRGALGGLGQAAALASAAPGLAAAVPGLAAAAPGLAMANKLSDTFANIGAGQSPLSTVGDVFRGSAGANVAGESSVSLGTTGSAPTSTVGGQFGLGSLFGSRIPFGK